jgi:Protein of unknown function (DUF2569)
VSATGQAVFSCWNSAKGLFCIGSDTEDLVSMKPPLTGWLILLIVILVGSLGNGMSMLNRVTESYKPYYDTFPSLANAVLIFQVMFVVSIGTAIYSAWVLYQRVPGTLPRAQNAFLLTGALRVLAPGAVPLFGGLPSQASSELIRDWMSTGALFIVMTAAWYLYLCRSKKVRQIYAASD